MSSLSHEGPERRAKLPQWMSTVNALSQRTTAAARIVSVITIPFVRH